MQEKKLFEYAVIRIMPRVERGEFINVGVILYCASQKYLQLKYEVHGNKIASLCADCDLGEIKLYLDLFKRICNGDKTAGPIANLSPAERFRWLTATRSTVVQTSKVHPGLCNEAEEMLNDLFKKLVS
ncbi:MAG: DUF3037 domain-containing protein [Ginsengibacter sp.]